MDRVKTMGRLKKRAEFLAVAGGARASRRGFLLQALSPAEGDAAPARFGFTVTKKMGNSPERNRIRRRLREAVRLAGPSHARSGADYVLVGRRAALSQPFEDLVADLISGLGAVSRGKVKPRRDGGRTHPDLNEPARDAGQTDLTSKDPMDDR